MTRRPDLFLLNVAYDDTGVHGHVFFRDPPRGELRQVIIRSTDTGNIWNQPTVTPAPGGNRSSKKPAGSSPSPNPTI